MPVVGHQAIHSNFFQLLELHRCSVHFRVRIGTSPVRFRCFNHVSFDIGSVTCASPNAGERKDDNALDNLFHGYLLTEQHSTKAKKEHRVF